MFNVRLIVTQNPNLNREIVIPRVPVAGDTLSLRKGSDSDDGFWGMFQVTEVIFVIENDSCLEVNVFLVASSSLTEVRTKLEVSGG